MNDKKSNLSAFTCGKLRPTRLANRLQTNEQSYSIRHSLFARCFIVLFVIPLLLSCSDGTTGSSFATSGEAVSAARQLLSIIENDNKTSIQAITAYVGQWKELDDSVRACFARDTIRQPHLNHVATYRQIRDSVHTTLICKTSSKPRSYHDLFFLKEQTSRFAKDAEIATAARNAQPFFASLDSVHINIKGGKRVMNIYREFLRKASQQKIKSKEQMLSFIRAEHSYFTAFLQVLPELSDEDMSDITRMTEQCCVQVLNAAEQKVLTYEDAMIYLAMRTNKRLILNAQVAQKNIRSGKIQNTTMQHAHLWMMLQPFITMDDLAISVLSDKERKDLYKLADTMPTDIEHLAKALHLRKGSLSEMPLSFMKSYIMTL